MQTQTGVQSDRSTDRLVYRVTSGESDRCRGTSLAEGETGVVIATLSLFGAAGCVILTAVTADS